MHSLLEFHFLFAVFLCCDLLDIILLTNLQGHKTAWWELTSSEEVTLDLSLLPNTFLSHQSRCPDTAVMKPWQRALRACDYAHIPAKSELQLMTKMSHDKIVIGMCLNSEQVNYLLILIFLIWWWFCNNICMEKIYQYNHNSGIRDTSLSNWLERVLTTQLELPRGDRGNYF